MFFWNSFCKSFTYHTVVNISRQHFNSNLSNTVYSSSCNRSWRWYMWGWRGWQTWWDYVAERSWQNKHCWLTLGWAASVPDNHMLGLLITGLSCMFLIRIYFDLVDPADLTAVTQTQSHAYFNVNLRRRNKESERNDATLRLSNIGRLFEKPDSHPPRQTLISAR